jgi:hypothetical protein
MDNFDSLRPRSARAEAHRRERELKRKLEKLLEILEGEFGIAPDHPRYGEMLKIWRASR